MRSLKRALRASHVLDVIFFVTMTHALLTGDLLPRPLLDLLRGSPPEVAFVEPVLDEENESGRPGPFRLLA